MNPLITMDKRPGEVQDREYWTRIRDWEVNEMFLLILMTKQNFTLMKATTRNIVIL